MEGACLRENTVKLLKATAEKVKPTVPQLIFDGRKESENRFRGVYESEGRRATSHLGP
jgi:hypothetical protein